MTQMLALFKEEEAAANATEALQGAGHSNETFDILTGSPYPEGAFGEMEPKHRLYVFPLMGAITGFSVGLLLMTATQAAFPLVVGGKPILSIPAMLIPMYEGTMLGAILFTVAGIIFESRLPNLKGGLYDPRITEGYIGITMRVPAETAPSVEQILKQAGADDILQREG